MPVAYLRVRGKAGAGETLSLADELVLGRGSLGEAEDARMSRRHARVFVDDKAALGSKIWAR